MRKSRAARTACCATRPSRARRARSRGCDARVARGRHGRDVLRRGGRESHAEAVVRRDAVLDRLALGGERPARAGHGGAGDGGTELAMDRAQRNPPMLEPGDARGQSASVGLVAFAAMLESSELQSRRAHASVRAASSACRRARSISPGRHACSYDARDQAGRGPSRGRAPAAGDAAPERPRRAARSRTRAVPGGAGGVRSGCGPSRWKWRMPPVQSTSFSDCSTTRAARSRRGARRGVAHGADTRVEGIERAAQRIEPPGTRRRALPSPSRRLASRAR